MKRISSRSDKSLIESLEDQLSDMKAVLQKTEKEILFQGDTPVSTSPIQLLTFPEHHLHSTEEFLRTANTESTSQKHIERLSF